MDAAHHDAAAAAADALTTVCLPALPACLQGIRKHIGADSLAYLSLDGMVATVSEKARLIDSDGNELPTAHCVACFTGGESRVATAVAAAAAALAATDIVTCRICLCALALTRCRVPAEGRRRTVGLLRRRHYTSYQACRSSDAGRVPASAATDPAAAAAAAAAAPSCHPPPLLLSPIPTAIHPFVCPSNQLTRARQADSQLSCFH